MDRRTRRLIAIGWLFLLHGLLDVLVGLYRCHNLEPAITDLLAAALPRSQCCLLVIWLALGTEPITWRVCGLVTGVVFVLCVFVRCLCPDFSWLFVGQSYVDWNHWRWRFFFSASGPGDFLTKLPLLAAGIGLPLIGWRIGRAWRRRPRLQTWVRLYWKRPQFTFQDLFVWTFTTCVLLGMARATSPYPGWFGELVQRCYRFAAPQKTALFNYILASSAVCIGLTLAALWAARPKQFAWRRLVALTITATLPALLLDFWSRFTQANFAGLLMYPTSSWQPTYLATSVVVAASLFASLMLFKRFNGPIPRDPWLEVHRLPTTILIPESDGSPDEPRQTIDAILPPACGEFANTA